jgi:hypothetical protein
LGCRVVENDRLGNAFEHERILPRPALDRHQSNERLLSALVSSQLKSSSSPRRG